MQKKMKIKGYAISWSPDVEGEEMRMYNEVKSDGWKWFMIVNYVDKEVMRTDLFVYRKADGYVIGNSVREVYDQIVKD